MGVIFAASTDLGSAEHTSRFLIPFLRWLHPQISGLTLLKIQFAIRKLAHLSEYAVLAILLLGAFWAGGRKAFWQSALLVVLVAAFYATTDEFHQTFIASRTASPRDVLIDISGAACGVLVYWLILRNAINAQRARVVAATD